MIKSTLFIAGQLGVASLAGAGVLACARGAGSSANSDVAVPIRAVTLSASPDSVLSRFLTLTIPTVKSRDPIEDVWACQLDANHDKVRWLAAFRILSVTLRGDSDAVGTVAITTVADQTIEGPGTGGDRWTARLRTAEDTAHWSLTRSRARVPEGKGEWRVCGEAAEGFGTVMLGRDVRWIPGASESHALAKVDSIRRARGLPRVR